MAAPKSHLFTSESVSEGHPDKMCDQICDAILDAILEQDPESRVACEAMSKMAMVVVTGEITTRAQVLYNEIARQVIRDIGYNSSDMGMDYDNCAILSAVERQSPDISQGVTEGLGLHNEQGAGDQGMMFGYACNETPELMPFPITVAHQLVQRLAAVRKDKTLPYVRPDGKSQVTIQYENGIPVRVHTVVISTQHVEDVHHSTLRDGIIEEVIKPVIPKPFLDDDTIIHVNPTGRFVVGGPKGDAGLSGRKIIVDTYGGYARHGGGSFSGKDPSKVDRSGAYMARYIAKNVVAAGLARKCEVQLAYAIGVAQPVSVLVDTFNTSEISDEILSELIQTHFDLTPAGIIRTLNLKRPIYRPTASYGHFGRKHEGGLFTWENPDRTEDLKRAAFPDAAAKAAHQQERKPWQSKTAMSGT